MPDSKRVCYTCGKKYHYCSHCPEYRNLPEWMNVTCCEECHDLYVVCANFNLGKYSKKEAQDLLSKYDLSQINIARPNMIHTLQKIYVADEVKAPVAVEAAVVEEEVPDDNNEDLEKAESVEDAEDLVVVETTDVEETENFEDAEQPKPRRRKKIQAVLDELDE